MNAQKAKGTARIKQVLWEQLETKSIHEISARDVYKKADLASSTFYLYYKNIEAVYQDICQDMLDPIRTGTAQNVQVPFSRDIMTECLNQMAQVIDVSRSRYRLLFHERNGSYFFLCFKDMLSTCLKKMSPSHPGYVYSFAATSCTELFRYCLQEDDAFDSAAFQSTAERWSQFATRVLKSSNC